MWLLGCVLGGEEMLDHMCPAFQPLGLGLGLAGWVPSRPIGL